ncbi:pentapeptide repeat-containing protein [Amycolatopsis sp. cmx-11-51]|uniref:pentapeptide repeat-containing protein n=1 Tax=unclassified Amycolatopsis TaxID=2618356 RepID=UPI0039E45050
MRLTLRVLGWIAVVSLAAALVTVVLLTFGPLPREVLSGTSGLSVAERIKAESDVRTSLLQAVAGTLLVIGAVTAWRQMLIARGQHRLSHRTAVTEAFTKAVEQLGDADSSALRLGGIYSLDRVAEDDPAEARRIGEILAAFVRERATTTPVAHEVAAAVSVLAARKWPGAVDLSRTVLTGLDLGNAKLSDASLAGSDLTGATLCGAHLRRADLSGANLREADLKGADLREAALHDAKMSGAVADSATRWPTGFVLADNGVRLS